MFVSGYFSACLQIVQDSQGFVYYCPLQSLYFAPWNLYRNIVAFQENTNFHFVLQFNSDSNNKTKKKNY